MNLGLRDEIPFNFQILKRFRNVLVVIATPVVSANLPI
jgi:hypothetical protein